MNNNKIIAFQRMFGVMAVCILVVGCQSQPVPEARNFNSDIKRLVLDFEKSAKSDPQAAQSRIEILVENLDEANTEPLGEHKATIDQITALAKELQGMYGRSASSSQTAPKIKEMAALANKLPGEVGPTDAAPTDQPRDF